MSLLIGAITIPLPLDRDSSQRQIVEFVGIGALAGVIQRLSLSFPS